MAPRLSIGLTFYNSAETLPDALRSIFAQTFRDWELIIVDDHSSDGSLALVQSVKDPRVRVYTDTDRKGFVYQLNRMTGLARGDYYARMDSDDLMHPDRLSRQVEYLDNHPDVDLVDTSMYSMDLECRVAGLRQADSLDPRRTRMLERSLLHHATVAGRTLWFKKNPYDPGYVRAEDCELWCRTFATSHFGTIREPLYFVREGKVSLRNYLMSCRTVRLIIRRYGPALVGRAATVRLFLKSYLKGLAYRAFAAANSQHLLVQLRNEGLDPGERLRAQAIVDRILSTPVPGLPT